jgi:hypothetical protein
MDLVSTHEFQPRRRSHVRTEPLGEFPADRSQISGLREIDLNSLSYVPHAVDELLLVGERAHQLDFAIHAAFA